MITSQLQLINVLTELPDFPAKSSIMYLGIINILT